MLFVKYYMNMLKYYQRLLTKNLSREILKTIFFYISLFSPLKTLFYVIELNFPITIRVSKGYGVDLLTPTSSYYIKNKQSVLSPGHSVYFLTIKSINYTFNTSLFFSFISSLCRLLRGILRFFYRK